MGRGPEDCWHRPGLPCRDLWDAIESGSFPEWELGIQLLDVGKEDELGFDILDATKLIPEAQVPVQIIGKLVLNRNPDNFFAETEQVAFHPGHLVPGIDFSNDPLLQGRLFSYTDAQLSRLGGANFHELPINRSVCPIHNFQRDGLHRQSINKSRVSYEPNTLGNGTEFRVDGGARGFQSIDEPLDSRKTRRRSASFDDHFSQASLFWNSQSTVEKEHIVEAFRFELSRVDVADIRQRVVDNLAHVDLKLASRVAAPLGIGKPDPRAAAGRAGFREFRINNKVTEDKTLSMVSQVTGCVKTRRIAILVADGVEAGPMRRLQQDLVHAGAVCKLVSAQLGNVSTSSSRQLAVDHTFASMPSVMFDAVLIPGGKSSALALCRLGDALHFVLEAYKHCKTICAINDGAQLLSSLGFGLAHACQTVQMPAAGIIVADAPNVMDGQVSQHLIASIALHRHWERVNIGGVPA